MGRALTGNASVLFDTPRAVPNKVTNPRRADARLAVLWVGHATTIVQMDDKMVLTDPVFTDTVGQLSKRLVEPGIRVEDVPPVDVCLVSHMHFDHLSLASLDMLEPKIARLLVPEGGLVYVPNYRFPMQELAWWRSVDLGGGMIVTAVPVKHNGWRYGVDASWMTTSFTGYVIEYHGLTVYFGGDTAFTERSFRAARERFPHIDLALLPIAPIHPREIMKRTHMDGHEAVQAFLALGAQHMVPIHFDTFVNSGDDVGDAERYLRDAMNQEGLTEEEVQILAVGEERTIVKRVGSR